MTKLPPDVHCMHNVPDFIAKKTIGPIDKLGTEVPLVTEGTERGFLIGVRAKSLRGVLCLVDPKKRGGYQADTLWLQWCPADDDEFSTEAVLEHSVLMAQDRLLEILRKSESNNECRDCGAMMLFEFNLTCDCKDWREN